MSATDELRRMLDERGVEWYEPTMKPNKTWFPDSNGINCCARPWSDKLEIKRHGLTPEQAIAATLGRPTFNADLEQALSFMRIWISEDAHLGESELSAAFEKAEGLRKLDAIESAIAATLGGGECEFIIEDNMNESEGMGDVWFRCTNCNATFGYYADGWLMKENFCPNCGRKVKR